MRRVAREASTFVAEQASELRKTAADTVERLQPKPQRTYEEVIAEYNAAFTLMSDSGLALLRQRERSTDLITLVEALVNSISNTPKAFQTDFDEIDLRKAAFTDAAEFARADVDAARASAAGAGAGITAGAAVASLAPTAAMWVATTFGTASTGTAISTLGGAAATNAALAWLGGGAVAAGGGGTVTGGALLALAGPVGWSIAGATLLASIALFAKKRLETREAKQEALKAVQQNTAVVQGLGAQLDAFLQQTSTLRESLLTAYGDALALFGEDFRELPAGKRSQLGALVNNTKACAALLSQRIEDEPVDE
ncbi:hypothetical protein [Curtobacterium sp. MCBD17_040]|uniref:hypothetical protein n=1 Tax=Curtobacterium sp. MCBD17_040 TaxID=2175674 RepID=UPI001C64736A|nr:hypothetical protein [Curtobacterium sp. MCBD17_040]WIB65734.1 hypothetical protein DEI94_16580 [Curtobacterium sp. MCBD17_040]